jgi:hypothetical protein
VIDSQTAEPQHACERPAAVVRASKEIALQGLLIDPVVNSASAVKLLDELWDTGLRLKAIFGEAANYR